MGKRPPASSSLPSFKTKLVQARELAGYVTAKEFAAALGVQAATYTRYERGETDPSLLTLVRIRKLTGIPLDRLLIEPETGAFSTGRSPSQPQPNPPKSRH